MGKFYGVFRSLYRRLALYRFVCWKMVKHYLSRDFGFYLQKVSWFVQLINSLVTFYSSLVCSQFTFSLVVPNVIKVSRRFEKILHSVKLMINEFHNTNANVLKWFFLLCFQNHIFHPLIYSTFCFHIFSINI